MTTPARASKRQKTAPSRNPFIDDMAAVDCNSDENTDDEDEFVQLEYSNTDDSIEVGFHARVDAMLRAEDNETANADIDEREESTAGDTDDDIRLSPEDGVWEIRCKINCEWRAISALLEAGLEEDIPSVKSATFREDRPGRIYVELPLAATFQEQHQAARQVAARVSLDMLTPRSLRFIPCPDATTLFGPIRGHVWRPGMWARIRGPHSNYRGDIGFIFSRFNKTTNEKTMWVAVVPRINIHKCKGQKSTRPPAQRLSVKDLKHYLGIEVEFGKDFMFRRQIFNYSGYVLYRLEELDLFPPTPFPPIPLADEFDLFLGLPVLSKGKWGQHRLAVWQHRGAAGDRVKIVHGKFKDMIGVVLNTSKETAEVYLQQVDDTELVGICNLRSELQCGDHVQIVGGEYIGTTGFITKVDPNCEWVDVFDSQNRSEICLLTTDVEFYIAPTVMHVENHLFEVGDEVRATAGPYTSGLPLGTVSAIHDGWLEVTTYQENSPVHVFHKDAVHTTSPKTNRVIDAIKKGQIDMYAQYQARFCIVVSGPWKSHRGIIKTTHPEGWFGVELDTRHEQLTIFQFDEVLIQSNKLAMALPPPISALSDEPAAVIPMKRPLAILFPDINIAHSPTRRPRCEPPPVASSSTHHRTVDHSRSDLPVPVWLLTGDFVPHRIKLVEITGNGPYLEYLMPTEDGSEVHVRDSDQKIRKVPVEHLRHVLPEKKNDLVVPITGPFVGKAMKVKEFGSDECTLTVLGAKRIQRKNYNFPRCNTCDLAIIGPPRCIK